MTLDTDKIDDASLAILSLTLHDGDRVWKGIDWNITDRLFEKGRRRICNDLYPACSLSALLPPDYNRVLLSSLTSIVALIAV